MKKTLQVFKDNEDHVPSDLFATEIEFDRELYYWESVINAYLDNKSQIEISVGKCWWNYARSVLHMQESQRRQYHHLCSDGRRVLAWGYPIRYLPAFKRWLREVYFPEKFPAYRRYRAERAGTETEQKQISTKALKTQLQLARHGMTQPSLFAETLA